MNDWFTESFGEDYLVVYRHRSRDSAQREIASMMKWMDLRENAAVLDIGCGMGRHALAIRALGYEVTGLDLSDVLLGEAKRSDPKQEITWIRGDMRKLPFDATLFDAAVNWFTSFGYFEDINDNVTVLSEMGRVLKPNGRFLIDFLNPAYVQRHIVPISERVDEPTGLRIIEKRTIVNDFVVKKIEVVSVVSEGEHRGEERIRRYEERVRLIGLDRFADMFERAGLALDSVYGDYDGSEYDAGDSKRLIMLGRRPS